MILWALAAAAFGSPDCVALDASQPSLEGRAGARKMALVVGVGDYLAEPNGESIDLVGPPNDALRIRELLVERYGFPSKNVCMLRDAEATRENFLRGWKEHLGRAASGDTVVYYFAGHGSQTTDFNGPSDETDGMDETILLHDSRAPGGTDDLLDDEFNGLLADLYKRTENITVIVDACNSGTTTRGVPGEPQQADEAVERRVEAVTRLAPTAEAGPAEGKDYKPERLPGIVVVTAAQDGTSALERRGQGLFTNALLRSLEARGEGSWEQLMQSVPRWIAAQNSFQKPTFEGRLNRKVFGSTLINRELSWQVMDVRGDRVRFRGPAMPGWTEGALLEVMEDGNPKYKARVRLDKVSPMQAEGAFAGGVKRTVVPGDFAILAAPGKDATTVSVQVADDVPFGSELLKALKQDKVLSRTLRVTQGAADFYVRRGDGGTIDIWGSEGVRRNRLEGRNDDDVYNVAQMLGLHARQSSLLALSGEPNEVYPGDVLSLRIAPMKNRPGCERTPYVASDEAYVEIPMCNAVQLEVELINQPRKDLYLGVLYLGNDGSIEVWPRAGTVEILRKRGEKHVEPLGWLSPPLNTPDRILVFGTHEQVNWSKLAAKALDDAKTRGDNFTRFITSHVKGTRGIDDEVPTTSGDTAWTAAFVQIQVVGDETKWTKQERDTKATCSELRQRSCN